MRIALILIALFCLSGTASATTIVTKVPSATLIKKISNCTTTCRTVGNQQICNTHCW